MSLPTLVKTWQYNVNNQTTAQGSALATNRKTLRGIKGALVGFGTNPWTVRYSCDSVAAGSAGDAVDRWDADTDLVWAGAGSAHSWMVLRQTGISSTFELLISCEGATGQGSVLTLAVSTSAFSGGSTTARPTATDEVVLNAGTLWTSGTDVAGRWSVWQSSDGGCTRVLVTQSTTVWSLWIIDKPANATTGWTNPYVALAMYNTSAGSSSLYLIQTESSGILRIKSGSAIGKCTFTVEGISAPIAWDSVVGHIANEIDGGWDFWPLGFACLTSGIRGRHGSFVDLWMGSSTVATLDTYPNDSSRTFVQMFGLVFPWDGSVPALS